MERWGVAIAKLTTLTTLTTLTPLATLPTPPDSGLRTPDSRFPIPYSLFLESRNSSEQITSA
ncbi:MAG: hypothetical protein F6K50_31170 [Moorea sp. SIO3I7]|nr:hypothetical protein [Moorena sp. SIO3I7]